MSEKAPPDDPRAWLDLAVGDLALARAEIPGVPRELNAFHAQQAAEKAIKAICIHRGVRFPFVHDLARLLRILEQSGQPVPADVAAAKALTPYAAETRYPSVAEPVTEEELARAIAVAETVVLWAERIIGYSPEVPS